MRKMFFLMLMLIVWGAASVNAQVTIGSDKVPHSGAVLDLQSDNLGLKLPNVALDDNLTVFGLPVTSESTAADAKGMYVYNTNPDIGEGVYVWDGYQWLLIKKSTGEKRIESIKRSETTRSSVVRGQSLQIGVDIVPSDATEQIEWSVDRGTGNAVISQDGLLTGALQGWVNVNAKTSSGVLAVLPLAILPESPAPTLEHIGSNDYLTYDFNGDIWMIQNSREGTAFAQMYDGNPEMVRGFYYTRSQANTVTTGLTPCPGDWHLPTVAEGQNLLKYVNSSLQGAVEWGLMIENTERAGRYNIAGKYWESWTSGGQIWLQSETGFPNARINLLTYTSEVTSSGAYNGSVRCVKNK